MSDSGLAGDSVATAIVGTPLSGSRAHQIVGAAARAARGAPDDGQAIFRLNSQVTAGVTSEHPGTDEGSV